MSDLKTPAPDLVMVNGYFVFPVPSDTGDYYISGTGHICCNRPVKKTLSDGPVMDLGICANSQIVGYANIAECRAAGIEIDAGFLGLLLKPMGAQFSP